MATHDLNQNAKILQTHARYVKPSRLLWEASSHTAINADYLYIDQSIARYSFTGPSELEQYNV